MEQVEKNMWCGSGLMSTTELLLSLETQLKKEREKNKRLSAYRNNARKHARRLQRAYNELRSACLEYDMERDLKRLRRTAWFYASIVFLNIVGLVIGLFYDRF